MTDSLSFTKTQILVDGLAMAEAPRWHAGALYFSDVWFGRVYKLVGDGVPELVAEFPGDHVSGLGFLPNGDLLAVLMISNRLMRVSRDGITQYADLRKFSHFHINDMIVHNGYAFVSQLGFDIWETPMRPRPTDLIVVRPDGSVDIAEGDMHSPNGIAMSADGATLHVAEPGALRITTFAVSPNGMLSNREVFAQMTDAVPDGICLDDQGGVWAAIPVTVSDLSGLGGGVQRIEKGGTITHKVVPGEGRRALACTFGGDDRAALFVCVGDSTHPEEARAQLKGGIERIDLPFRGAGLP